MKYLNLIRFKKVKDNMKYIYDCKILKRPTCSSVYHSSYNYLLDVIRFCS